jgi:hypothetical protein
MMAGMVASALGQNPNLPHVPEGLGGAPTEAVSLAGNIVPGSLDYAESLPLIPCAGNAQTWRSYVSQFQGAYCLLQAFLVTPAHRELCLQLCRRLSDNRSSNDFFSRRHIVVAMKVLAQTLLCFADFALLQVLWEQEERRQSMRREQVLSNLSSPAQSSTGAPIFLDGGLHPKVVEAVSITWAALLALHKDYRDTQNEIVPVIYHISKELSQSPLWQPHGLPAIKDTSTHRPFAQKLVQAFQQSMPSEATSGDSSAVATQGPAFIGSEWQRPKRGGEVEILLLLMYWLAMMIDRFLGRELKTVSFGLVPQTEWPRLFANWKLTGFSGMMLLVAVLW